MPEYDPFNFETGGFTEDYDAVTVSCEFAPGDYNFQATLTNRYDEPEVANDGTLITERRVFLTIGGLDQWRAIDGGRGFAHVSGENYTEKGKSKVRANSGWATYINRMLDLAGRNELLAKGDTFQASIAEGWHLHWETEGDGKPYSFKDKVTGELKEGVSKGKPMPTKLLDGSETAEVFKVDSLALAPDQLAYLEAAANDSTTLGEFQAAVLPWVHKAETGLSDTQKKAITEMTATSDPWLSIKTII